MFTGLVQALGRVATVADDGHGGRTLTVAEPATAAAVVLGESVAVNGVCLTVTQHDPAGMTFQVGPETLHRTNLGELGAGNVVNLEQALRVGDRLGGHFVTGHVDAVGRIQSRTVSGEWETVAFACPPELDDMLVAKGSIAVDGVSLTVVDCGPGRFTVMLIPHTLAHTTLGKKGVGATVNLETDLLAKHVLKLVRNVTISI